MTRLIDADALVENIKSEIDDDKEIYPDDKTSVIFRAGMKTVIRIVKNQDTVDPIKHGYWIDTGRTDYYLNKEYRCSCCDSVDYMCSLYCYNCGAKMDNKTKKILFEY